MIKKTALTIILLLALIVSVEAQVTTVLANPMYPFQYGYPQITVVSPVQDGTYPQDSVWLNFTVTKPLEWIEHEVHLYNVSYFVDYSKYSEPRIAQENGTENKLSFQDPAGAVNPPLEFNFSIKLTGLSEGFHSLDFKTSGGYESGGYSGLVGYNGTICFIVTKGSSPPKTTPTPSPTSTPNPSPEPTSTPTLTPSSKPAATPEATSQPAIFPATLIFVASAGIAAVVTGSFLHIKKLRGGKRQ